LFALPSIRLGGNIQLQQQPRKALEQQHQHQHQHRWWQHDEKQNENDERGGIDAIADDLDVDALFELEEVKPHEMVEEHQTSSRGDREHARAPSMEGDDEEEEREAFEATEGGGSRSSNSKRRVDSVDDDNVTENKDAIGAGGEEEEDKLENLDMSWSEKEEHENAIREEEGNAAKGSSSKYSDNDDDALDAISAESSASQARIKKLKQLIKPRKMRVFLSLKAINPGCRYLSEGLGNVERSDLQGNGYGKLVTDPSQLYTVGSSGSTNNGLGVSVQQQKQTIIYDGNGEPMTKKPSGASVAKEIASNAGSGGLRKLLSSDDNTNISPDEEAANARISPNKCRVRWSTGRDGKEMSTTPMEFKMLHVARKQALELETQFLPRLPHRDYDQTYKTCAVVANGGVHLRAQKGKEIDEHEAVFRINYAPVSGKSSATNKDFSKHVGSRTTFDVVNRPNSDALLRGAHTWRKAERQPGQSGFAGKNTPGKTRRVAALILGEPLIRDARREQFLPLMRANKDKEIYLTTPETTYTFRYVWHELKKIVEARNPGSKYNDKPMTGWTTVMLAVQRCENVSLYGFQPFKGDSKDDRYHYFDRVTASLKVHSFDLAFEVFKLLRGLNVTLIDPEHDGDFGKRIQ
jgi:hypothetical protein